MFGYVRFFVRALTFSLVSAQESRRAVVVVAPLLAKIF